jgi:glycosyltransferase involved in cell wall biosynthesis
MKILMLLESKFPPDIRVENEVLSLLESGHEVTIVCKDNDRGLFFWGTGNKQARVISKKMPELIRKSFIAHPWLGLYESFWRKHVFNILQDFDVIHVHDLPLARLGYEISRLMKIPFVLDLHENYPALLREATHTKKLLGRLLHSDKAWRRFERDYIMTADRIITICEESAKRIRDTYDRMPFIVQNTINLKTLPDYSFSLAPKDGMLRIIYGGGINHHRGIQTAIEAMKILQYRGNTLAMLMIIGDGSYKKTLVKQANGMKNIIFKRQKPYGEFMRILSESHLALIPHLRNENNDASSPNKLYQYMYAGITILSSNCTSLATKIQEIGCGFIFEAGNAENLADLIETIDNDRKLLEIGKLGQRAVRDKYNWENDSKELIKLYKSL